MTLLNPPATIHVRDGNPEFNLELAVGDLWIDQPNDRTYRWDDAFWHRVHTDGAITPYTVVESEVVLLTRRSLKGGPAVVEKPTSPEHYGDF